MVKKDYKLEVLDYESTKFMAREEAQSLEERLKAKYAADCLGGEFYDVRFVDVCKDLREMIL